MSALGDFVRAHTERGECQCGLCIDKGDRPDPEGHTVDMVFFKVAVAGEPNHRDFLRLTRDHEHAFLEPPVDPFDGREHNYVELGAWIGDQGLAMQYMALGAHLGLFALLSPRTILPPGTLPPDEERSLAALGFLSVKSKVDAPAPAEPS